jgi:hypothetical protein
MLASVLFCANHASATVSVTAATGGSAISADTTSGCYTSLSGPTIAESANGVIHTGTIPIVELPP